MVSDECSEHNRLKPLEKEWCPMRKFMVVAVVAMFAVTGLFAFSQAGETGAKVEEMKGGMKGTMEEGKGQVKGAVV
jgi:hypothetical protein